MAKRSNDLLSVFRGASSEGPPPKKRRNAPGKKATSRSRRGTPDDGLVLQPRHALLASAVVVLLLVLAFTVGLGVGRGGFGSGASLDKRTADAPSYYWIRGSIPSRDVVGGREVDREALLRELGRELGLQRRNVAAVPADDDLLYVFVGGWKTRALAQDYLRRKHLDTLRLRWGAPFHFADIVEGLPPR